MHGFLLLRKGKIVAEGYWAPYTRDSMHRMYSVSKSFVSMAVGLMIDEGKLNLNDRVAQYFKDKIPKNIHPYLAQATIRDLLIMATPNNSTSYTYSDTDWAATFFNKKPSHPPGTIFSYDTAGTVILNTIVERVSGMPFLEYMRDKLFEPTGVSENIWCIKTPEDTSWGGSGVICKLRDMAKMAYVCMNKGRWGDLQLISEEYINEATSKQIDNSILGRQGYGYQIWMEEKSGFSFRGLGSQYAYCFPDKEFMFACISNTQVLGYTEESIKRAFYEEIYNKTKEVPLPEDVISNEKLNEKIKTLKILPQKGNLISPYQEIINNKWYMLDENPMGITKTRLIFSKDTGIWEYENASGHHMLKFGIGKKVTGPFPQKNYYGKRIGEIPGVCYNCLSSAAWVEECKLNMLIYITDIYLGSLKISFAFKGKDGNEISIYMAKVAEWFLEEYSGFAGGYLMKNLDLPYTGNE